jgi:dTDP-4-amino-4,6-dideoxygalactose transaminase
MAGVLACVCESVSEQRHLRLDRSSSLSGIVIRSPSTYRRFPMAQSGAPVSERLAAEVISLPMHPYLDETSQDRIIAAVRRELE